MVTTLRKLTFPPFLQRLDEQLLLTRPALWATKLHRVVYLSTVLSIFAFVLSRTVPVTQAWRLGGALTSSIAVIVLLQIALLIFWLYGSDHYHVEREFGRNKPNNPYLEIAGSTATVFLILSSLLIFINGTRSRIQTVQNEQFAAEMFMVRAVQYSVNNYYSGYGDYAGVQNYSQTAQTLEGLKNDILRSSTVPWLINKYGETWDRSNEYEFMRDHLTRDSLAQFIINDSLAIDGLLTKYTGLDTATIDELKENPYSWNYYGRFSRARIDDFGDVARDARSNLDVSFNYAFSETNALTVAFWVIVAAAMQVALVRFVFRHTGLPGFLRLALYGGGILFAVWMIGNMQYAVGSFFYGDQYMYQGQLWETNFHEHYGSFWLTVGLVLTGLVAMAARRVDGIGRFRWRTALQLYILPFLLIATPYMLIALFDIQTDLRNHHNSGAFYRHLIDQNPAVGTWSLAPLGTYILYSVQFAWLPFIPYLKKQHVRLLSLPRG